MRHTQRKRNVSLLVIEPDPAVRRLLAAVFSPFTHVTAVANVDDADRVTRARAFDLAVVDLDSCDLATFDLDVPLVLTTTAHGFLENNVLDLRHRATVHKPFSPASLAELVRRLTNATHMLMV